MGVLTGWDDGFYIRSSDKRFSLRVTGQLQADYRWYADAADLADTSGFVLRRVDSVWKPRSSSITSSASFPTSVRGRRASRTVT